MSFQTLLGFIEKGGVLMAPLLLFSILALWIFLERGLHLRRARTDAETLYNTVCDLIRRGATDDAAELAQRQPGPVVAVLAVLLTAPSPDKPDLEEVATMQARCEWRRLTLRLPLLNLIAGLAPLVGLLGTVVGMVKAFQQVATSQGAVNPGMLAGGIWEALLTTVAGLVVAIPALMFHHVLDQCVKRYVFEIDHYGGLLIRLLCDRERFNA